MYFAIVDFSRSYITREDTTVLDKSVCLSNFKTIAELHQ